MEPGPYDGLLGRFVEWADGREDLRAAVVIGSRAREHRPADEFSDLDLLLVTTDPGRYLDGAAWTGAFGDPILSFVEGTATGDGRERRVLYAGGLDVDFVPVTPSALDDRLAVDEGEAASVLARGYAVVYDEIDLERRLADRLADHESPTETDGLPTEAAFRERVHDFLYHALWSAKKLARGETWTAKGCVDGYLKWRCLLPMVEWHAAGVNGVGETWHEGRFLESWADERVLTDLRGSFADYDPAGVERGLLATVDLFRWVARETAEALGYDYPAEADERVSGLVRETLAQADGRL